MLLQLSDNTQQLKVPTEQKLQEKCCPAIQLNSLTFPQHTVSGPYMLCVKIVSIQWQSSFVFLEKQSEQSRQTLSWYFTITPMLCNKAVSKTGEKHTRVEKTVCLCWKQTEKAYPFTSCLFIPCTESIPTKSSNWSLTLKVRFPIPQHIRTQNTACFIGYVAGNLWTELHFWGCYRIYKRIVTDQI